MATMPESSHPAGRREPLRATRQAEIVRHLLSRTEKEMDRMDADAELRASAREIVLRQLRELPDGDRHLALLELDEALAAGSISQAEHGRRSAVQLGRPEKPSWKRLLTWPALMIGIVALIVVCAVVTAAFRMLLDSL